MQAAQPVMKGPAPGLASYLQRMNLGPGAPQQVPMLQQYMDKLKKLEAKKQEFISQINAIDAEILKTRGALEVLQTMRA